MQRLVWVYRAAIEPYLSLVLEHYIGQLFDKLVYPFSVGKLALDWLLVKDILTRVEGGDSYSHRNLKDSRANVGP